MINLNHSRKLGWGDNDAFKVDTLQFFKIVCWKNKKDKILDLTATIHPPPPKKKKRLAVPPIEEKK